jgi:hypothetical protein
MPVTVERLPNEPILIATLTGYVSIEDIREVYCRTARLIGDDPGVFYRITDAREATSEFTEMLKAIQVAAQGIPFATSGPRIVTTMVGTNEWITFYRNALLNRGVNVAGFVDMETALESVRIRIANDKNLPPTP